MGTRLDRALVERGLARSRGHARDLIAAGLVQVDGRAAVRPAMVVVDSAAVVAAPDPYVSRAAHKLLGALEDLSLGVAGRALDAGASTGGFTQVLLEHGCTQVTAVDVGVGQLAPTLRADPRVRVWERTNLRDLSLTHVGGQPVDLIVADVSFISLTLLVEPLISVLAGNGRLLLLVKPQFEVGRERLGKNGLVRDPRLRQEAVDQVLASVDRAGGRRIAVVASRLPGAAGNEEFFALCCRR